PVNDARVSRPCRVDERASAALEAPEMPAKWAVAGGRIDRRRMNFFRRWNSKADGRRQVGLAAGNHRSQPADRREQKSSAAVYVESQSHVPSRRDLRTSLCQHL